jgi:hypothetical protein
VAAHRASTPAAVGLKADMGRKTAMPCRLFPAGPPHRTVIRSDGPVPYGWLFRKEVFILPILPARVARRATSFALIPFSAKVAYCAAVRCGCIPLVCQQLGKFICWQRPAEIKTLHHITTVGAQKSGLRLGLYPFGHGLEPQACCQRDDSGGDGGIIRVIGNMFDKGTINLNSVDRKKSETAFLITDRQGCRGGTGRLP